MAKHGTICRSWRLANKNHGQELWDRLVEVVRADDKLPVFPHGGDWTPRKLYFVCQYLEQVTRGMYGNRRFPGGLTYIDLFCGTGVSQVPTANGGHRRYPGSPLIAASTPKPFNKLILCDIDAITLDTVQARIKRLDYPGTVIAHHGNVNDITDQLTASIPTDSLNIAFVDPFSLDIQYRTIQAIARKRALDLIILFSDRMDLGRNVFTYYLPESDKNKLDGFLGCNNWREDFANLPDQSGQNVRTFFADVYLKQLAAIGYKHSQSWPLPGRNGPAFRLVFASKHPLGIKYCEIALKRNFDGDERLF